MLRYLSTRAARPRRRPRLFCRAVHEFARKAWALGLREDVAARASEDAVPASQEAARIRGGIPFARRMRAWRRFVRSVWGGSQGPQLLHALNLRDDAWLCVDTTLTFFEPT